MKRPIDSAGLPAAPAGRGSPIGGTHGSKPSSSDPESAKPRKSIQSVETGVRVLEALISMPFGRAPLRKIGLAAGMSRSQAHRYLLAYINSGLVVQEADSGLYGLGPMALRLGLCAVSRLDVVQQSSSELFNLVESTGCTGILSIMGDFGPTIVRWIDGERRIVTSISLGSVLPLQTSTPGVVFLAFQSPAIFQNLLERERSRASELTAAELSERIRKVRKDGYASASGRFVPGLAAISAPIYDMQGWPAAVFTIISRSTDLDFLKPHNVTAICQSAGRVSLSMGWQSEEGPAIAKSAAAHFFDTSPGKPVKAGRKRR